MNQDMTTKEAARALGVPYYRLSYLLRSEKIRPPAQDGAGNYRWTARDIRAAKAALEAMTHAA